MVTCIAYTKYKSKFIVSRCNDDNDNAITMKKVLTLEHPGSNENVMKNENEQKRLSATEIKRAS